MPDKPPTRSLRPAVNAAARMQEVMKRQEDGDATSSPVGNATSSAVALPTGSEDGSVPASAAALPETDPVSSADGDLPSGAVTEETVRREPDAKPRAATTRKPAGRRATGSAESNTTSSAGSRVTSSAVAQTDPLKVAMLGLLAQPYPENMKKGPMTVTSVKIPTPIWERLEFVRALTKKDKQEIIAEALLLHFERVQRTGGEEE